MGSPLAVSLIQCLVLGVRRVSRQVCTSRGSVSHPIGSGQWGSAISSVLADVVRPSRGVPVCLAVHRFAGFVYLFRVGWFVLFDMRVVKVLVIAVHSQRGW